ncbi:MAG: anhydro-N-acetylmuramic acid kinase [Candidatus Zixiibacteriota bacterium]
MSLAKLMKKQKLTVLGLNSGTSADGIDMAVLEIRRHQKKTTGRFIQGKSAAYPISLRSDILELSDSKTTTLENVITVDQAIGTFFGQKASSFVKYLAKKGISVDAIASHGQTVRHIPDYPSGTKSNGTLQLGSLEIISTLSNRVTVGDFRQADIALGNEGAPITVAAMHRLFASDRESRLIVNIGGISNYFYFPSGRKGLRPLAGDCGPGNSLCDILSKKFYNKNFDKNGTIALNGKPSKRILSLLLAEPFFTKKTVSTGREAFGRELAEKLIQQGQGVGLSHADILSTAAEFTVLAITHHIKPLLKNNPSPAKLYLTGGGRKNKFFVKRLRELLKGIKVVNADELGFDANFIEAAAYAVMGEAALRSEPLMTRFDGKNSAEYLPVLGKVVQPPVKA